MGTKIAAMVGLALILSSTAALAEETAKPAAAPARGTFTTEVVKIHGRVTRPQVAVDIARIAPQVKLSELRQPFVEKIGQAAGKDAF